jgi:hypothetical protein
MGVWGFANIRAEGQGVSEKGTKTSPFTKFFKNKKYDVAQGKFITLYKSDSKVYFELPLKYLGSKILFATTVSSVGDPSAMGVGSRLSDPIYFSFEKEDGIIVMKKVNTTVFPDSVNSNLKGAIDLNFTSPSLAAFKIEAYNNDSTAVLFDMSSFVAMPNAMIPVVPKQNGNYKISSTPASNLSFVKSIKAFDTNISIKTEYNYTMDFTVAGIIPLATNMPNSVVVTHSFLLLPKDKMVPRLSDARIGIFSTKKMLFPSDEDGINSASVAHRWRLIPKDIETFRKGGLSEPIKPIVFYIDNTFPEEWKAPIREGVLRWNKAFEKIHFKNVMQVRDFPNDSIFDADNIQYSCIRYIPNTEENASGPSWVDPSTGEIIGASVFVYHNIEHLLHKWRFIQTANVDPTVRGKKLPKKLFDESLSYAIAHEVGHTLGLMHNMKASSAYPTDSLRSATFTKEYGTTPSIMDYARFNYIAQPGDKNVTLTPPLLGLYDYYAIDWNYHYYPDYNNDIKRVKSSLDLLVDQKVKSPIYRFLEEQGPNDYDPSCQAEDLGDNPIKSGEYAIRNLKAISKNLTKWIKDDEDSSLKDELDLAIAQQFHSYFKFALSLVGGIYLGDSKESSGMPRYKVVDKKTQREALIWAVDQLKNFRSFANKDLERNRKISSSYYDQLIEYLSIELFRAKYKVLAAQFIDPNSYTQQEFVNDFFNQLFKGVIAGKEPTPTEMFVQRFFIDNGIELVNKSIPSPSKKRLNNGLFGLNDNDSNAIAHTHYLNMNVSSLDKSDLYYYACLKRLRPVLKKRATTEKDAVMNAYFKYLLFKVDANLNLTNQ